MDLVLFLATVKKISTTTVSVIRLVDYFAKNDPSHVKERLARSLEMMSEYMREKHQSTDPGDAWRNDWFAENQVSNRRTAFRLLEKTIKEIINDAEEKKSKYIAKFWVNICLTSNADIDESTAFSYLETIESFSWRQLCIIGVVILYKNKEVNMSPIDVAEGNIGAVEEKDVEQIQMSQDELTRFYSISRDFQKLIDNKYLQTTISENVDRNEPFLDSLHAEQIPDYTRRLHSLMNLDEVPIEEIVKTFSIWNVRPKKSEERHV